MKKILMIFLVSLASFYIINGQVLVNKVWTATTGEPENINIPISQWDNIDWTSSTLTNNEELITVGNTRVSPGNTDILLTKYGDAGQIVWEQKFAGSAGSYDYGLAVATDSNGNILVAGVVTLTNQTTDIILLKCDNNGVLLWSTILDGGNNQFDIPSALIEDGTGNIYVVGGTIGTTSQTDWFIAKFNSSGNTVWNTSYNYANLHELAIDVKMNNNNDIEVSGFSASSTSTTDFVSIVFSGFDGSLLNENREEIPDLSINDAFAIAHDDQNNIYVAGTTKGQNSGSQDIQLVKVNSSFNIEWIRTIDTEGLTDKAKTIAIDNSGDIIVAGNSDKMNGGTQITLVKFSPNGDQKFKTEYLAPATFESVELSKMKISNENNLFVSGSVDRIGNKDIVTLMYNSEGKIKAEKYHSINSTSNDFAKNLEITTSGKILMSGTSNDTQSSYTAVKYETLIRPKVIEFQNNEPKYVKNEVIVKFIPTVVNVSFVDDKEKKFGDVYDVLTSTAAAQLTANIELGNAVFSKVFPRLSTGHTTSITRLGDTIPIPKFWSTFLVTFSQEINVNSFVTQFETVNDIVVYAHPNHVSQLQTAPNDTWYDFNTTVSQSSLFPTSNYPDAHINVEAAWDIETGKSHTKVGVFDVVILWSHEDFGDGSLEGSQIEGGWNFVDDGTPLSSITNPISHGTSVAGIIGAIRNNNKGIAGIAGGGPNAQGVESEGVQLFSLGIVDNSGFITDPAIAAAIVEGAMYDPTQNPSGYGLHIQNHSHTSTVSNNTMERAVRFAWRNECIFVAGRGNSGNEVLQYPACYNDDWVINVGGSGVNGQLTIAGNGNDYLINAGDPYEGYSYGGDMDLIAPATVNNVISLINPNFPYTKSGINSPLEFYPMTPVGSSGYQKFNGTSAAAPHVAGVAALMHSRHHTSLGQPNNLAPEDVEFILQRYSTDIVNPDVPYPIGYDIWNGHGRVDAFEAVRRIEGPAYQVYHNGAPDDINLTTVATQVQIILPETIGGVPAGSYFADRILVTNTYINIFSSSTQILDGWRRLSSSNSLSAANPVVNNPWATYNFDIQNNMATVTTTAYVWHITGSITGQSLNNWVPTQPQNLKTNYSLHLYDSQLTNVNESVELGFVSIFPNPNNGQFRLTYTLIDLEATWIRLIDVSGRLVKELSAPDKRAGNLEFNLSNASSGVYICQLITNKGVVARKLIKY